ncbi:MAG TPA: multicopper oxidase domain-containing protein [Acidimicrobiia bacterium]|nr:multicopper oxidase domain-containing protein [Acidimicrobiia bacterium]
MAGESSNLRDRAPIIGVGVVAVVALILAIIAIAQAGESEPVAATTSTTAAPTTTQATTTTAAPTTTTTTLPLEVELAEFSIGPGSIVVGEGAILDVTNAGSFPHDLTVEGTDVATPVLQSGESAQLDLSELPAGTYRIFCAVGGHDDQGMNGTLVIGGDTSGQPPGGHDELTSEELAENMRRSIEAFPAATEGTGALVMEPTILDDGTKEFVLVADEIQWEVAPGDVVDAYAYNGQIPGPTIKVNVGDRVRIVIENRLDMITSFHPHGVRRHPNSVDGVGFITQEPIRPGETWAVEWVVEELSVGMYHGHDMGVHQVPNGLAGAFLVGEVPTPEGWNVVAEEFMFLNDAGNIGLTLNAKSFPATTPYNLQVGEAMMLHYMNEGLSDHPMHLHNNRQLVIAKDGFPLEVPYYADTINVASGERYTVLILAELPGQWLWHCHIFTHAERNDGSMFGMLTTLTVDE